MGFRIVFFGTPAFAVPTLDALVRTSHQVVAAVTQPDKPRGRGHQFLPSPVKAAAIDHGIPVLQPDRLKQEPFVAAFQDLQADIGIVAAYGKILPQSLLDTPRLGMINVHASLLPRWRGAAPIHRAVLAGDEETGITIMRMVQALDAGASLAQGSVSIGPEETSADLEGRLAQLGAGLLVETLERLLEGGVTETPQDENGVTYASRLERHESRVDWTRPARDIHNQIRGLQPWPLAAAVLGGKRLLLLGSERVAGGHVDARQPGTIVSSGAAGLEVSTGDEVLRIVRIQPEGKAVMSVRDFLNGHRVQPGDRFDPLPIVP